MLRCLIFIVALEGRQMGLACIGAFGMVPTVDVGNLVLREWFSSLPVHFRPNWRCIRGEERPVECVDENPRLIVAVRRSS